MNLSEPFIRRPVATVLLTLSAIAFGAVAYQQLPVSDLPAVDYPTIQVSASLPGASPETMASTVATPLERQFSAIAGLTAMNSTSGQGGTSITLEFDLDRDLDGAALDVQSAISAAGGQLPPNLPAAPTYRKVNPADDPIIFLALTSASLPLSTLNRFGQDLIAQRLATIPGVAQVQVYGSQRFAVRVQVDPRALASRGLGIDEVAAAIRGQNSNLPTGIVQGTSRAYTVEASGGLEKANEFGSSVVAWRNGAPVRLSDLGRVRAGVENENTAAWFYRDGKEQRAIVMAVLRQPGTNTVAVAKAVAEALPLVEAQMPAAARLFVLYDRSISIQESVADVKFTLWLTLGLVVLVIFLFLRNVPATVIPSLALPVSLVGTFAVMWWAGYSLDNLSLMALTLAVGFVVDDAIVMLENVVRHLEMGKPPLRAALDGSREVAFTIVSMTISLAAVFLPILFMGGLVGRLFHEFAVTIGAAILVSGLVSLTLTPMLCARFLSRPPHAVQHGALYRWTERGFEATLRSYGRGLDWALDHPRSVVTFSAAVLLAMVPLWGLVPKGFLPTDDAGRLRVSTEGAEGTSFDAMVRLQRAAAAQVAAHPDVEQFMSSVGSRGVGGVTQGNMFLKLRPREERRHINAVVPELRARTAQVAGLRFIPTVPPPISLGGGGRAQYTVTLQDADLASLYRTAPIFEQRLRDLPDLTDVTSDLRLASPRLKLEIDRDRAAQLGVSAQAVEEALYSAYGSRQVSPIFAPEDQYQVILELLPELRADPQALGWLHVRAAGGKLVPLDALATVERSVGPLTVSHAGQLPAVNVSFNLKPGSAIGPAVAAIERTAAEILPATVITRFQGAAQAFRDSLRGLGILLLVSVLVIYVVLGILYESFVHPITILTALPFAGFGALVTLWAFGAELSVYAFVGVIMLVGLVKKNGIMMVDFALEAQREGKTARQAIHLASLTRFRPIMMTTMAALFGTLPLAIGVGAGAEGRRPLGLAVVGGLVFSQFLTLYVTPVFYVLIDRLRPAGREANPASAGSQAGTLTASTEP
ncbi:MAG: efflux RND transporter permease subunit [Anaeromyxobacter sp.]|nr:efflux RND transporter permease subunit [Anaeromyxobacter sp.]